ncbi:hypothetical protein ACET3Z_022432 [Daucus carota]
MSQSTMQTNYRLKAKRAVTTMLTISEETTASKDLSLIKEEVIEKEQAELVPLLTGGATKVVYAPDPFDVGRTLQDDITKDALILTSTTTGPIDTAAGLGNYVEALVLRHDTEFNKVR